MNWRKEVKRIAKELVWTELLGPFALWVFLGILTTMILGDIYSGDSQIRQIFGVPNWALLLGLAISWWIVWLGWMMRRDDDQS